METSISKLAESVLNELHRLSYSKCTISQYKTVYKKYARFAHEQGIASHSVELGDKWLYEECGIDIAQIDPGVRSERFGLIITIWPYPRELSNV